MITAGHNAPKCPEFPQHKCFAEKSGKCGILTDTVFERRCPFYKSLEQYTRDYKKYGGVLRRVNGKLEQIF